MMTETAWYFHLFLYLINILLLYCYRIAHVSYLFILFIRWHNPVSAHSLSHSFICFWICTLVCRVLSVGAIYKKKILNKKDSRFPVTEEMCKTFHWTQSENNLDFDSFFAKVMESPFNLYKLTGYAMYHDIIFTSFTVTGVNL